MMTDTFADITDPSNPFNVAGISDEDRALLTYLRDAKAATGDDVVVSCTTDHPAGPTRHLQAGTGGEGLAIDCRMRRRGNDIHRAVFDVFVPVERQLYELIYAGAPYNIKAGRRVAPYAVASHHDHVHVAVNRGVFVRWPGARPSIQEDDMTDAERAQLAVAAQKATDAVNYAADAQQRLVELEAKLDQLLARP